MTVSRNVLCTRCTTSDNIAHALIKLLGLQVNAFIALKYYHVCCNMKQKYLVTLYVNTEIIRVKRFRYLKINWRDFFYMHT